MRGFLQKDIALLGQNRSLYGIIIVMMIFMVCVRNESFIIVYSGMMGGFLAMSIISYDDADRGMGFLMTLPSTRKIYAVEKYILGYGVSFLLLAAGTVIAAVSSMFRNSGLEKGDLMLSFETGVMIVAVIMIVLVPVQLKFGAENGRIIMAAVFMGLFGVFYFVVKVAESFGVDVDQVMVDIQSLGIPVIAGVILVFLGIASFISCLISIRIMERKEF